MTRSDSAALADRLANALRDAGEVRQAFPSAGARSSLGGTTAMSTSPF